MAITVWEAFASQHFEISRNGKSSFDRKFFAAGSANVDAIQTTVRAGLPDQLGELVLTAVAPKEVADGLWEVLARYRDPDHPDAREEPETGDTGLSFDLTGVATHITQSLTTVGIWDANGQHANQDIFKGAVGVNGDDVAGCDVITPKFEFQDRAYVSGARVTVPWMRELAKIVGRTNKSAWGSFEAGELLFLGAKGTQRGRGDWEIGRSYGVSFTEQNIQVGAITVPQKRGWDYLWVRYRKAVQANRLVQEPDLVIVDRVYHEAEFGILDER